MIADDPAAFLLGDGQPNVFVDNYMKGLFETAEQSRESGNNNPKQERRTTA